MSFNSIPIRQNADISDTSWWNTIRTELINFFGGGAIPQTVFTIANNQSSAADITGLVLDKASYGFYKIPYTYFRRTDSANERVYGVIYCHYNVETDTWTLDDKPEGGDLGGVEFSISGQQIQYASSNMAGASYEGTLTYKIENAFGIE